MASGTGRGPPGPAGCAAGRTSGGAAGADRISVLSEIVLHVNFLFLALAAIPRPPAACRHDLVPTHRAPPAGGQRGGSVTCRGSASVRGCAC